MYLRSQVSDPKSQISDPQIPDLRSQIPDRSSQSTSCMYACMHAFCAGNFNVPLVLFSSVSEERQPEWPNARTAGLTAIRIFVDM